MVFSGLYPVDGDDYPDLRDALERLQLNDAALVWEPETSAALGFGFRCGFLGLLHLEIVRERLEREFDLDLISTAPNVVYRVVDGGRHRAHRDQPERVPRRQDRRGLRAGGARHDPRAERLHRRDHGPLPDPPRHPARHGLPVRGARRAALHAAARRDRVRLLRQPEVPTRGYASLDYEVEGEQASALVKVDILLQGEAVDAFSAIVHKDKAYAYGVQMTQRLRELIPRQQFEVPIQAAIGSRVIARENIRAIRKDVLAKCYGGDITRKRKLLEKQKEGKKRMKMVGRVEVPQEAFIAALSTDSGRREGEEVGGCPQVASGRCQDPQPAVVESVNVVHALIPDLRGDLDRTAIDKRPVDGRVAVVRRRRPGSASPATRSSTRRHHGGRGPGGLRLRGEDLTWWAAELGRRHRARIVRREPDDVRPRRHRRGDRGALAGRRRRSGARGRPPRGSRARPSRAGWTSRTGSSGSPSTVRRARTSGSSRRAPSAPATRSTVDAPAGPRRDGRRRLRAPRPRRTGCAACSSGLASTSSSPTSHA